MNFSIQSGSVANFTASRVTGWYKVTFPKPFSSTPVVFAQIQTCKGSDTPGIRLQNVTENGFEVRMNELMASGSTSSVVGSLGSFKSDGEHPNAETLGWTAIA